jgi:Helicase associated domain
MTMTTTTTKHRTMNPEELCWDLQYSKLQAFHLTLGHANVPNNEQNKSLFRWKSRQCLQWRYALDGLNNTMNEIRMNRLTQLGVLSGY